MPLRTRRGSGPTFFSKEDFSRRDAFDSAEVKTLDELRLPPLLHEFSKLSQGFVLVVGPAGQGKSTTLAAILDEINHKRMDHIVTVEDPIEYLFVRTNQSSLKGGFNR
jgi:twitching motility protein PilT